MLQNFVLRLYEWVARRGLLRTEAGREVFHSAYEIYKALLEAPGAHHLQRLVLAGTTVIDVGANIGFFTVRFADWTGARGRVLAIEPDTENLTALRRRMQKRKIEDRVQVIAAVATQSIGVAYLKINPDHPGDHSIGESGIKVAAVTIDQLMSEEKRPPLSLIKIDVQGAEMRVLAGAKATLAKFHPALVIEIGDEQLRSFGSSAAELIDSLAAQGYQPYALTRRGLGTKPEDRDGLLTRVVEGYCDVVFLTNPVS